VYGTPNITAKNASAPEMVAVGAVDKASAGGEGGLVMMGGLFHEQ
jgi:hypothetical protein